MLVHAWLPVYYFNAEIVVIQSSYRIQNLFLIKIPQSWNSCWNTPSLDCHHRKQHCRSNLTYSFIFSHNLCTIAKNVVWDWNADITWYISFFNMCVLDQQTKEKGYTQDILAFLNEDFIIGQSHCLFNMFTKLRHILSLNITPYIHCITSP